MQILINVILYAALLGWLYINLMAKDWWYCFVILFVISVSGVVALLPGYHASSSVTGRLPIC